MTIDEQLKKIIEEVNQEYKESSEKLSTEKMRQEITTYLDKFSNTIDKKIEILATALTMVRKIRDEQVPYISTSQDVALIITYMEEIEKIL